MNNNLVSDTEDMETFIFAEDEHTNNAVVIHKDANDNQIPYGRSVNALSIYQNYKMKHTKTTKRKKRKKHKNWKKNRDYDVLPCISERDAFALFESQTFLEEAIIREGHNIPTSLKFDPFHESAFMFGKTLYNDFVGKSQDEDGHISIFGGSGSGKTTGISIPTSSTWQGSIFTFDFKGDLIKWAKKRNPKILYMIRGQKNLYWYDPFYFLRSDSAENLIQNARELAHSIIPMPQNLIDEFWIDAARAVLTGAIVYYFDSNVDFIAAMIEIKITKLSDLLKKISSKTISAVCVNPDLDLNPKTLAGVSMELHNHISVFATDTLIQDILSPSEDTPKDIIRWEDLEIGDIFIRVDHSRLEQWKSVVRMMVVQLMRTLARRPEKYELEGAKVKSTLLMLDEFPQYGRMDVINSSMKILRSKNVTIAIFCQSLADLDETYGKTTRRAILDNCPYQAILSASDAESQRYFSELVGTVRVPSKGLTASFDEFGHPSGYSISVNESREAIIHPHEFGSLQDIVLLHPGPERFCRVKKEMHFRKESPKEIIEG